MGAFKKIINKPFKKKIIPFLWEIKKIVKTLIFFLFPKIFS